jgi:hypothetical protein
VRALAGARGDHQPAASAPAAPTCPASETIARECAAQAYIGSFEWAYTQLQTWTSAARELKYRRTGTYQLDDDDFVLVREELLHVHELHGRRLVGLVESFGLADCALRAWTNPSWAVEARRRWDHLALDSGPGGELVLHS